jgi:DNA (cytosine-5)-methyltransferase 1
MAARRAAPRDKSGLKVVSLFSGALGLDLGLEEAGFKVAVAVECNRFAAATIRKNRRRLPLIEKRIEEVKTEEILKAAAIKVGEAAVVTGGPSCQAFSTAGHRRSMSDPRGVMFREFLRVVREARPRFFVMENVRGVLSAAARHRPLRERGPGYPRLRPEEELGSAFALMLKELKGLGYYVVFDLVNAADYGTPQVRERVLFIGSRDGEPLKIPPPTHAKVAGNGKRGWVSLRRALKGLKQGRPVFSAFSSTKKKFLRRIPEGGNWRDLPQKAQRQALGRAYRSWGGRVGFFRRLAWDRPAPALTTRPDSKATMLCHPRKLRPLSVGECARLQQFRRSWRFNGGRPQQYIQVGNAVPVGLGRAIGRALREAMAGRKRRARLGTLTCPNAGLIERLCNRPRTVLNPRRMRKVKGKEAAKAWLKSKTRGRAKILDYVAGQGAAGAALRKAKTARVRVAARRSR